MQHIKYCIVIFVFPKCYGTPKVVILKEISVMLNARSASATHIENGIQDRLSRRFRRGDSGQLLVLAASHLLRPMGVNTPGTRVRAPIVARGTSRVCHLSYTDRNEVNVYVIPYYDIYIDAFNTTINNILLVVIPIVFIVVIISRK